MDKDQRSIEKRLHQLLESCKTQDFKGYDKFDALNSPVLNFLSLNNKYLRFLFQQAVKILPFNVRPIFFIPKERNPKGIALFAKTYLLEYERTQDEAFLNQAEELLQWLIKNRSKEFKNYCWGYNFIWETLSYTQKKYEPNVTVSVFVGEAFIKAYEVTKKEEYLKIVKSIGMFLLDDIYTMYESKEEKAQSYFCGKTKNIVLNIQVMLAGYLIKIWDNTKEKLWKEEAQKLINFTINRKTDYNAWFYTYPKEGSLRTHDNYHTGGILDGLLDFVERVPNKSLKEIYQKGLKYYKKNLFEVDGAPRWMNDKKYPLDIHSAAQGIITFSRSNNYQNFTKKLLYWTFDNLGTHQGNFYYQKHSFFTDKTSFMRWGNAWMCLAMAEYLKNTNNAG